MKRLNAREIKENQTVGKRSGIKKLIVSFGKREFGSE